MPKAPRSNYLLNRQKRYHPYPRTRGLTEEEMLEMLLDYITRRLARLQIQDDHIPHRIDI
ncbi:hypothetical protein VKT23_004483 [Stygiomarasmius scandens]|uniref:Uncharacterized protein n=1 Tax=Marasmiellus scandens TaxID=2682957 RepID=A0ABR1JU76_9AGAR